MATLGSPSPPSSPSYKHRRRSFVRCERACCSLITYFPLAFVYGLTSWAVWVESAIGFRTTREKNGWGGLLAALLGISLYLLANLSYTIAVFTDPGSPLTAANGYSHLPTYETPSAASFTVKSSGSTRYCKKCQCSKPDRTHHCSTCHRCVLKMDHHCPWLATCLGLRNYKAFVLFLIYTSVFCWVSFAVAADWLWGNVLSDGQFADTMMPVNYVLLAVVSGIIGLVLTGFTGWHLSLALKNQTTIECLERVRYLSPLRQRYQPNYVNGGYPPPNYGQQLRNIHTNVLPSASRGREDEERPLHAGSQPASALASLHRNYNDLERERERDRYESYLEEKLMEKLPNAFDLGWRANLYHLFGPNPWLWCLPVCNSTGDGWNWEPSPKWLEARDTLLREREEQWRLQDERERRAGWGGSGISPAVERRSSWDGCSGTLVPETSASWPPREERAERHYLAPSLGVASVPTSDHRTSLKADQTLSRHPDHQYPDHLDDDRAYSDSGMSMRTLRSPHNIRYGGYDRDGDENEIAGAYEGSNHEDSDPYTGERGSPSNSNDDGRGEGESLRRTGRGWIRGKAFSTTNNSAENRKLLGREGREGTEDEWRDWSE
ncbi:MAG: palmitoyltransferase for Vac8p [Trichoglossum hirsutum]|nr:MAG: palmitoyltransferase for Vac8p [Trichoglossum hirsutum]